DKILKTGKDNTIQVNAEILDVFLNNITQLVLVRNQLQDLNQKLSSPELNQLTQNLNRVTASFQEKIMLSRMQPLSTVWNKLPRLAFDLAKQMNKDVELHMSGEHINVDKSLLDTLKAPMTHIIRNAIDHG